MSRETPSPIDLPEPPSAGPGLGWSAVATASATLVLLIANAVALRDWIDDLPPSPAQAQASTLANGWVAITDAAVIGQPRAWLHERWKAAEAARF